MKFFEQLKKLDANDIGRWPLLFRALLIGILFVAVVAGGTYMFVWRSQLPELDRAEKKELTLKTEFEAKQRKAANFEAYKLQLDDMQRSFGAMLRQLPGKTEVPNLLVDISQTGLAAGLEEKLFQPASENRKDFYAELPIRIRLTGDYHEMGNFASGIAALPRIVTLHDIEITPPKDGSEGDLVLNVTAKTYRYLDEEELASQTKEKAGAAKTKRKKKQ